VKTYAWSAIIAFVLFAMLVGSIVLLVLEADDSKPRVDGSGVGPGAGTTRSPNADSLSTGPDRAASESAGSVGVERVVDAGAADVEDASSRPFVAPLPTGGSNLTIVVRDATAVPIVDAIVTVRAGLAASAVATVHDGSAVFPSISPGVYSFIIESVGRPAVSGARPIEIGEGEDREVVITLGSFDLSIAGRVLDANGAPVSGIDVYAVPYLFQAGVDHVVPYRQEERRAVSAADGRYVLDQLADGEYEVRTVATEVYPEAKSVVRAGVDSADLVLRPSRNVRIFGVVRSSSGDGVEETRILAVGQASRSVLSDAEGNYELDLSLSGEQESFTFRFVANGFQEHQATVDASDLSGVEEHQIDAELLPLKGLTQVEGVLRARGAGPVAGETVHLHSDLLKSRHQATTDAEGRFRFDDVQAGMDYRVWVRPGGAYEDYTQKGFHVVSSGALLEIELEPLAFGTLRGYMVDGAGEPVGLFSLWLRSTSAAGKSVQVTGDAGGYFEVAEVPAGPILFETRSLPRFTVSGHTLRADEELEVKIVLDWGSHEIRGRVVDKDGVAVSGARLYLSWHQRDGAVASVAARQTIADDRGSYQFTQIGPGAHRLNVNATGYRSAQIEVDVGQHEDGAEIVLEPIR
jgi:protocatechuate 3,4-dioxygenase beta subunit